MSLQTIDRQEQERRRHIHQWARMMITHLEGTDHAQFLSYGDSLVRLRALLDLEIARADDAG